MKTIAFAIYCSTPIGLGIINSLFIGTHSHETVPTYITDSQEYRFC